MKKTSKRKSHVGHRSTNGHAETKLVIDSAKAEGCIICGEQDTTVIQFHHVNPEEKLFTISRSHTRYGIEKVRAELAKCVTLCGNCHIRVHQGTLEIPEEYRGR